MTFNVTLEEFKQGVAEFTKAAPTCDDESLENGMKAVNLLYLGMQVNAPSDVPLSVSYLEFAHRRYIERRMALDFGGNPLTRLKKQLGMEDTAHA